MSLRANGITSLSLHTHLGVSCIAPTSPRDTVPNNKRWLMCSLQGSILCCIRLTGFTINI
ncbi:hypothetical protein DM02DRAFT_611995 [Periconia macrospinosa]|uniref:Uncharacterized protein n=1 Tax=Periconia macrospinosa TaxID=97972 RepID=A0A2V1E213_9PLEO|nr:hypothetical protein DM02DRAFT_611995 [Periconia macrospinosa]